jgi:hypothetical protein
MRSESASTTFERDRSGYIAEFHRFDAEGHQWSQWELDLVNGVGFWIGRDQTEAVPDVVAAGFVFALFEEWQPLDELRFETLGRASMEAEIAETFGPDWGEEWPSIIYGVRECHNKIEELAADAGLVTERMPFTFEKAILPLFEGGIPEKYREICFGFFKFGVAAGLYFLWQERVAELGVLPEQQFRNWEFVESEDDRLADLDLPTVVHGCELRRHPLTGYELRSTGSLGGGHITAFRAEGDLAAIFAITKRGALGERAQKVPTVRHVDALRDLGFKEMRFPSGKRYELRTWPGVRRVE